MRSFIKSISNNKKIIIGIILAPITVYFLNILCVSIFNVGTYLGTFLRNLYSIVVCWIKEEHCSSFIFILDNNILYYLIALYF